MIDTNFMCNKHLLGEHVECHMFLGSLKAGKKHNGYYERGLLDPHNLFLRHDELAAEMRKRGMKHKSNLLGFDLIKNEPYVIINIKGNMEELQKRCSECRKLMEKK